VTDVQIRIHPTLPLGQDKGTGHNRWHPAIKPVAHCRPGDVILMETRDAVDGQISPNSTVDDVAHVDSSLVHPLTGPVHVEGAKPGDLLEVEILDVVPARFGYTLQQRGFGFLRDLFPESFLVKWHLEEGWATSADIPGFRVRAAPFMGTLGVAPGPDLLKAAAAREAAALARGEFVFPPFETRGAVPDGIIGSEGLRTGPPRENGGNLDVKEVAKGAKIMFPVFVEGALFSAGDAHFAQGDGEVCGQGIEMRATFIGQIELRPGGAIRERVTGTRIISAAATRPTGPCFITTGLSLADDGSNHSENATLAARRALVEMIDYLEGRGFSRQQAYTIASVAVDLRISELVDVPNVLVSASLPLDFIS
jgi:formamidase